MSGFTIPIPNYWRREQVQALKIKAVIPNPRGFELHFEDERFCPVEVMADWMMQILPSDKGYSYLVGGYVVWHCGGSFMSWSKAEVFEVSYTQDGEASL